MARNTPILLVTFLLLAGVGPKASGDPLEDASARELKAMAGTWRPISTENNGYKSSPEDLKGILWIRDADGKWTMRRDDKTVVEWAVQKIDATKNPKTIDIEIAAGSYKGVVYHGIYELLNEVQKQHRTIDEQKARIAALELKLAILRSQIEAQETRLKRLEAKQGVLKGQGSPPAP